MAPKESGKAKAPNGTRQSRTTLTKPKPRKQLEVEIVKESVAALKAKGWLVIRNHAGVLPFARDGGAIKNPNAGIPDVQAIKHGHSLWLEFKRPGWKPANPKKPNPSNLRSYLASHDTVQENWLEKLRGAGCRASYCTSVGQAISLAEEVERDYARTNQCALDSNNDDFSASLLF